MAKRRRRKPPKWLVIDGCPAPYEVAAQLYMVLRKAGQYASSIYRGEDPQARTILHAHGKHTQAEIHAMPQYHDISNPSGQSEHDLHSDGHADTGPVGRPLEPFEVGVDSGGDSEADKERIRKAAASFGWHVEHPYTAGVEGHHWHFDRFPKPQNTWQKARIAYWRLRLPRQ